MTYLSSGRGNLSIILVVITFDGRLADGDAPHLPSEHCTNSEAHREAHEVDDSKENRRCPMLPGVLEKICLTHTRHMGLDSHQNQTQELWIDEANQKQRSRG
jgi:hypothetical protein